MTDELGAGPALDRDFDLEINPTGDIKTVSGVADLEKDLSFQLAESLDEFVGQQSSPNTATAVRTRAERVAELDPRVEDATAPAGGVSLDDRSTVEVRLQLATTTGETQEFVFTVDQ